MHSFKAKNGSVFQFNSDLSGEILYSREGGSLPIDGEDVQEFCAHWIAEYAFKDTNEMTTKLARDLGINLPSSS